MTFGYVVVPLFFSCVSGAAPSAKFVKTGETTVLTFGFTAHASNQIAKDENTIATAPSGLIAKGASDLSAKLTCVPVTGCADVTVTPALAGDVLTLTYAAAAASNKIAANTVFSVAVSGLTLTPTTKEVFDALGNDKKTFELGGTAARVVGIPGAVVATFEFKPATTPAGEVCANTDGATKNTKACGCKAKNAKEEEQTYPCTADQVCDATATTAETACKATASNGSSLFLLAAFFLAMN
jgi:hypothetical protein